MKNVLIPLAIVALIFGSCKTSQLQSYDDDIYTNPSEEKKLARIAAAEKAKKEAEEKQKQEEAALAQKAKDDANPYYKDPQYNSDDYYDYKYASQIRRFNNPVSGAGYYNNYYTNSYMYNQNPSMYGSSIYSSYNWWMPSNQFGNYNNGLSLAFSTGNYYNPYGAYNTYGGYNPYYSNNMYGCNYGGYNPYYGYGGYNPYYSFNPYGYNNGYMSGYYNGFNNGYNWGYFNSYDVNSSYSKAEYGPRGSNGGGNSSRQTTAGMIVPTENSSRSQFIKEVATSQENMQQFTEVPHRKITSNTTNAGSGNLGSGQIISSESGNPRGGNVNTNPNGGNVNTAPATTTKPDGFWPRIFGGGNVNTNSEPIKNGNSNADNPVRGNNSNPVKIKNNSTDINPSDNSNNSNRSNNSGNFGGFNSGGNSGGGSSSPRSTSGGGSGRPR